MVIQANPKFIVIDLFCGAGGVTSGFVKALRESRLIAFVVACINHDWKAIKSHWENHPEVEHFNEDITRLYGKIISGILFKTDEFERLIRLVNLYRTFYPDAKVILWASLECTNFSKAKGGKSRDADSRTLAEHLQWYIDGLQPDYIQIENVVEFLDWGPLNKKGQPIKSKKGVFFRRWNKSIKAKGYGVQWTQMNSADYGAYTSRNRLFGIFSQHGLPVAFPQPTHHKTQQDGLKKWEAVRAVLNFEDQGESVVTRKKKLCDATLERVYGGLVKFVAKGDTSFLSKYYSGHPRSKTTSINSPAGTLRTKDGQALVQAEFLQIHNGKSKFRSVDEPCPTVATHDRFGLVQPEFFIEKQYGNSQCQSIQEPAGTIVTNDKHRLVTAQPFLMPTNYDNQAKSLDEPAPTITANRKYHYLVNPQWGGHLSSIESPCPVLIARQDKAPLYIVEAEQGPVSVAVYDDDSEVMVRIKKFMVAYDIVDIKMRMLRIPELLDIQGFPKGYKLTGNQGDQKKFIGNSVVPLLVQLWTESLWDVLYFYESENRLIA
ncbi:MAG TPA: DNA cytosine methyltransferase [Puia sp.]|jgi:DNA (cytosine-5)-methyltransferase 1